MNPQVFPNETKTILKAAYLTGEKEKAIAVDQKEGPPVMHSAGQLAQWLLTENAGYKIAYVTDGAAHEENFKTLLPLIQNADVLVSETCFMEQDRKLADETKHFTALFIARLATKAKIKKLVPFHFSKRYLGREADVFVEIGKEYTGEVQS